MSPSAKPVATANQESSRRAAMRAATFVMILFFILVQLGFVYLLRDSIRRGFPDFISFYTAGKIVATGNGSRLYDLTLQQHIQGAYSIRSDAGSFLPFVHLPLFAVGLAILAWFPYLTAYYIWWCFNQCLFWASILLLDRALGGSTLRPERLAFAAVLFLPVTLNLCQGQDSLLTLFSFTLTYFLLSRKRPLLAGAALGLITFKPQLALLMFVLLVLTWRNKRRFTAGCLLGGLGQILLPAILLGWRAVASYPRFVTQFAAGVHKGRFDVNIMPNLRGILHFLLAGHMREFTVDGITAGLTALLLLSAIYVLRSRNAQAQPEELRFAFVIATTSLAAYHGFLHDLTLLLLPLLIVWNWLAATGVNGFRRSLLAAGIAPQFLGIVVAIALPSLMGPIFACASLLFWSALLWNLRTQKAPSCLLPSPTSA